MKTTIEPLPLNDLEYAAYQRPLEISRIARMAEHFDPAAVGHPLVSYRSFRYWVVDGAHRIQLLLQLGYTEWDCEVVRELTYELEAALWNTRNDFRSPTLLTKFGGRIEANDPEAVAILHIVKNSGWTVASPKLKGPGTVRAIGALQDMYRLDPAALRLGLTILHEAWPGDYDAVSNPMLRGIVRFLHRFTSEIDVANLTHRMAAFAGGPTKFIADAKTNTHFSRVDQQVEAALIGLYNKGRTSRQIDPSKNRIK